jgi:hypothetical protein
MRKALKAGDVVVFKSRPNGTSVCEGDIGVINTITEINGAEVMVGPYNSVWSMRERLEVIDEEET